MCLYKSSITSLSPPLQPILDGRQREHFNSQRDPDGQDPRSAHDRKTRRCSPHTATADVSAGAATTGALRWAQLRYPLKFCLLQTLKSQLPPTLPPSATVKSMTKAGFCKRLSDSSCRTHFLTEASARWWGHGMRLDHFFRAVLLCCSHLGCGCRSPCSSRRTSSTSSPTPLPGRSCRWPDKLRASLRPRAVATINCSRIGGVDERTEHSCFSRSDCQFAHPFSDGRVRGNLLIDSWA